MATAGHFYRSPEMAKKYHQSTRDRMHEREGEKRHMHHEHKDRMHEREGEERHMHHAKHRAHMLREREEYAGHDMAREQERRDSRMICEDHNAVANLPQEVMMKSFPRMPYGLNPYLDDTISGIDEQQYDDTSTMHKGLSKSKY